MMLRIVVLVLVVMIFLLSAPAYPVEPIVKRDGYSCRIAQIWVGKVPTPGGYVLKKLGESYEKCSDVLGDAWREV